MFTDDIPTPTKVDEFSEHATNVPSDEGDWAGISSSTRISLQEDFLFEEAGIAFVHEDFDHSYQFITGCSMRDVRSMQEDVGLIERDDPDANGIVESGDAKYTLESRIQALAHTVLNDGRKHGEPTGDDVTIEYKEDSSLDRYVILIKW